MKGTKNFVASVVSETAAGRGEGDFLPIKRGEGVQSLALCLPGLDEVSDQ
jgi:hypothetical protein